MPGENAPLEPEQPVILIDRAGQRFTIAPDELDAALADRVRGFRVESDDERAKREQAEKYGERPIEAAAEGVARSGTFGLSDLGLRAAGVSAERLEGVKEENEAASTIGEVGGMLLPIPGTGVVGALGHGVEAGAARLLGKGAETLAGKVLAKGLGEAAVGTAYGVGSTISDAALGDTQITAERLLAGGGMGALLGFGFGGATKVAGELPGIAGRGLKRALGAGEREEASAGAQAAEEVAARVGGAPEPLPGAVPPAAEGASSGPFDAAADIFSKNVEGAKAHLREVAANSKDALDNFAAKRAANAAGVIQSDLTKANWGEEDLIKAGKLLLDRKLIKPGANASEILQVTKGELKKEGETVGRLLKEADQKVGPGQFKLENVLRRAQEEILAPLEDSPILTSQAKGLNTLLNRIAKRAGETDVGFAKANAWKTQIQSTIKKWQDSPAKEEALKKLQAIFNDEIEGQMLAVGGKQLAQPFIDAKEAYGLLKTLTRAGKRAETRLEGNRQISLSDYITGAASGGVLGLPGMILGPLVNKVARERGESFVATTLHDLAKSPAFGSMADAFSAWFKKNTENLASKLGPFQGPLQEAAAKGPDDLLLTHAALSETQPGYREAMEKAGLNYAEPAADVHRRASSIGRLKTALLEQDVRITAAVDAFLRRSVAGAAVKAIGQGEPDDDKKPKDVLTHIDELANLAADPKRLADRLTAVAGAAGQDAPNVAGAMTVTASRAVAFLHGKAPRRPEDGLAAVLPQLQSPWKPSDSEKAGFSRYVEAVANPETVLAHLQRGTITQEAVESLKAVYPEFYAHLRNRVLERVAANPKALTFQQKMALGAMLQVPLHASQDPKTIAMLQQVFVGEAPSKGGAAKPIKLPGNEMPESARIEARRQT